MKLNFNKPWRLSCRTILMYLFQETVKDPAYIPEDQLEAAYLESLAHPIGMPTLTELAGPGKTVTIVVPDRVKGGEQATSHRKLSIKYILKELCAAGIEKKDILYYFQWTSSKKYRSRCKSYLWRRIIQ